MCEPVAASMAALSVIQMQQQQQAQMAQANAQNRAYAENQRLQNEAYGKDMERYWDEEVAIQGQAFENAEDAADAKLQALIQDQERTSSFRMANMQATGGGQSPDRQLGLLRRQMASNLYDIDQQYQAGIAQLKGQRKSLQQDKINRKYQAMSAINSVERASYTNATDRGMMLVAAGAGSYMQYKKRKS
jgi:hypothetical protein